MAKGRKIGACSECGEKKTLVARGKCSACYHVAYRASKKAPVPAPVAPPTVKHDDGLDDYWNDYFSGSDPAVREFFIGT